MEPLRTLVVLDDIDPPTPPLQLGVGTVSLVSFHPDPARTGSSRSAISKSGDCEVIEPAGALESTVARALEKYQNLLAAAGTEIGWRGAPLVESIRQRDGLAWWWINEIYGRRTDSLPTFTRICQALVVDQIACERKIGRLAVWTDDAAFRTVLRSLATERGMEWIDWRPRGRPRDWRRCFLSMFGILRGNGLWLWKALLASRIARSNQLPGTPAATGDSFSFYTHYPRLWKGAGGARDEKYGRVPAALARHAETRSHYLCSLLTDGFHQQMSLRDYRRHLRSLGDRKDSPPIHLLDADTTLRDVLTGAREAGQAAWVYGRLAKSEAFRRHWTIDGIDFAPLFERELRLAALRTPRYLLHARRIRRALERLRPRCFVTHLYEFGYGRAMIHGARSALPGIPVVGAQHGPISARKAYYDLGNGAVSGAGAPPLPDWYLVEGEQAQARLAAGQVRSDRVRVVGPARLGGLIEVPEWRHRRRLSNNHRVVLVVLGQHDAPAIIHYCRWVLSSSDRFVFWFKPHPRSAFQRDQVGARLAGSGSRGWRVVEEAVHDLLPRSDVVVATYSSVALEAAARGYPLVLLLLPNNVNVSPLLDAPGTARVAASGSELLAALEDVGSQDDFATQPRDFFFAEADAERSWVEALREILGIPAQSSAPAQQEAVVVEGAS